MSVLSTTWQTAQTSIAAAFRTPYLHPEEISVGKRYAVELDDAIRRYGVGADYLHEKADPELPAPGQITTAGQARDFVASLRTALNKHFQSYGAHWKPTAREVLDNADTNLVANGIKAAFAAHRTDPSVHFNDDTANVVSAADATDDASLVILAEALRTATARHVSNAGTIVFEQKMPDASAYQHALSAFNARQSTDLATIAYAERVARAAQLSLGFTYTGGLAWENTPYTKLSATFDNVQKIQDRLNNIWEAGPPYTTDAYVLDVVLRASALVAGLNPPTPPTPPGTSTLVVEGTISTAAEAALNAAIVKVNKFAAAAAVK